MAQETPTWLNSSFVEKILRESEGDDSIRVIDIISKSATAKGDHYCSNMMRVTAKFSHGQGDEITEKSMIFKIAPSLESAQGEILAESGAFDFEISMISDTLNKMNKLLEPKYRLGPKGLYVQKENPQIVVMEDLSALGYRMADRLSGFDLDHSILSIRALARFHATSVAVCEKEPEQKKKYAIGTYSNEHPSSVANFYIVTTKALAKEIANWPGMKRYAEKIAKIADRIYEIAIDVSKPSEDEFNVINHGDYWVNNMLFKYDDNGKPIDHISVDFQTCFYTSPAMDLLYFLETSPSLDVIENKKDILLNEYLDTLSTTMKQLNCKTQPPTMEELKDILKRKASLGMITAFTILPLILCSKSEAKDYNEIMNDVENHPGFKSEIFRDVIMKRIPMYDEWGLLDL
ncbi:uncharacterized protein LOC105836925 [Monomorium pharaonis]|uniref:uncharacterized protein LOC105836925 n=1 Tax=Monomorium pharaonis TaxID=307658 RepID=UPI001746112A|nr:uncharacterized protein LOC105836925 [Monomorium pharaonis]XP_012536763.2 uncharacterized protein LOC105836925 [Monomorium pharaonis]XP_012536764.2 uncharacterized protein LOC105836925 [Monomorium pharaonis]XP_012536765.2 uncharacterized protein LOC105836925 [Monomorium pharaonis]